MADELQEKDYSHIQKDADVNINTLRKQITGIEYKQQELQNYITTIDNAISQLEQMIHLEQQVPNPNYDKIRALRGAISKNIELLSQIYNTYKEFENVKFRYFKEIDDYSYRVFRLIELDLKKANLGSDKIGQDFLNIMRVLSKLDINSAPYDDNSRELFEEAQEGLDDEDYKL